MALFDTLGVLRGTKGTQGKSRAKGPKEHTGLLKGILRQSVRHSKRLQGTKGSFENMGLGRPRHLSACSHELMTEYVMQFFSVSHTS